ncbi:single-stranded DNA-binding protein [Leuconostoc lactis]|uniref:single-stranded DNA-binding protein n=1 Tax=Leuconostoc lactis TaxID=1246 RepID=UPI0021A568FA|nr:single-stranded DNA-binding protein [Leuconostoc lactis]MCT3116184.1 single-stranded DNA-binding protein [Leuconostoc lactis]
MNQVNLTGRLTKDVEMRYTQSGKAVASGSIAVNRRFKSEGQPDADFINFVMWGKAAENFANFTHKGSLVGLGGEWQTRNYENNVGQRVYVNELNANTFDLLEPRGEQPQSSQSNNVNVADVNPFASKGNSPLDISDDDLPF